MSDYAHEWTDEQIEQLRRRFDKEYSQAAREMREKLEKALADYGKENSQRLKALDGTPEAQRLYDEWKRGQAVSQTWMKDMVHQLSESATHANMHAADMINDCLPHVYAENANMAAFALDKQLGYDTGFTLVNEDALRYLMGLPLQKTGDDQLLREVTWNPDEERMHVQDLRKREVDYPKDMRWNREKFQSAITQGILQGESIPEIVKRTNDIYGRNKASATRAARTATTNAENAGRMNTFERAQRLGIDMEIEWLATLDGRTRDSHRALDGERIQLGEKFSNGLRWPADPYGPASEIWNCFVGDTEAVPLGELQRSFRRFYDGDAVTVVTASGVNFTCTPNHPILTSEGWVAAGLLDDSYDLFVADLGNGLDSSGVKPDIKHVGTSLEAIHELVSMHLGNRACSLGVYFHEDVLARDVDVVTEERALRVNPKTLGLEPIDEIGLELPDTLASSDGPKIEFVGTPMTPPDSLMSSGSKPRALLGSGIRHALEHGLRTVSGRDSRPFEPDIYNTSTDAEVLGKSLHALSAVIKLDHVVNVDVHSISTHVYNLQTESGTYLASGSDNRQVYIIAHNCRCRANGRVVGFDGKRGDWADERGQRWTRLPKGMTYDEWKTAKAVSRDKSYENHSKLQAGFWPQASKQSQNKLAVDALHPETLGGVKRTSEGMTFDQANELRGNPNYNLGNKEFDALQEARKARDKVYEDAFTTGNFSAVKDAEEAVKQAEKALKEAKKQRVGYITNCQSCVVANEARRRGYDVEAMARTKGSMAEKLAYNTSMAWIDPSTGKHPQYVTYDGIGKKDSVGMPIPTHKRYVEWLNADGTIAEGERYTIEFEWKGKSKTGHILSLERTKDGLRMYDPQCGETYTGKEIADYLTSVKYRTTSYGFTYANGPKLLKISDCQFNQKVCDQILTGVT